MAQVNIWLVVTLSLLNQWSLPPIMKESGNYTGVWGVCMLFLWHYLSRCVTFYKVEKVIIILFVLGENSVHFSQYNYKILFPVRTFMCCKAVCRTGKLMHVIRFAPEHQNLKSALNWILNLKIIFFFMPAKEFLRKCGVKIKMSKYRSSLMNLQNAMQRERNCSFPTIFQTLFLSIDVQLLSESVVSCITYQ